MSRRWTQTDVAHLLVRTVSPAGRVSPLPRTTTAVQTSIPTKYRSQAVLVDGIRFASKLESRCYQWLQLRQRAGEVLYFILQPRFRLEGGVVYAADFLAALAAGGNEVVDATGRLTQVKANKLKQLKARYGVSVRLWTDKQ